MRQSSEALATCCAANLNHCSIRGYSRYLRLVSQMLVFPEPSTPRTDWMGWAEPRVNFLLTSTLPEAIAGRAWVNTCYGRFPDAGGSVFARLTSTNDSDYATALDELFLHECLLQCGRVTNEEGGRGPDFRIYRGSEYLGAIEVRSIFMRGDWSEELVLRDPVNVIFACG